MSTFDLIIVILYMCGMIAIGVYSRFHIKTVDDFLVAGHRFNTFSLVGTLMAALVGAGMSLGIVGAAYTYGGGIMWNYIGFAVGLALMALFFVDGMRKTQSRTVAEIFGSGFGRFPRFCAACVVVIYSTLLTALTIQGMGRIVTYICNGIGLNLNITAAVIVCACVVIGYTALGGLYSVVWTDVVQFCIMFVVIVIVGPIIAIKFGGGFGELNNAVEITTGGASMFGLFKNVPATYICASFFLVLVSVPGDPSVPQRALAGNTTTITKRAFAIAAVITVIFGIGLTIIGATAVKMIPDIEATQGTTEAALPMIIILYYPTVLKGLGLAALLAAVMSTISAQTLIGTTHLCYDIPRAFKPDLSDDRSKKMLPFAIIIYGLVVTYIALGVESIAGYMYICFSICGGGLMAPLLMALYWKKASRIGRGCAIAAGGITVIVMNVIGALGPGGDPFYLAFIISAIVGIILSLACPGRSSMHGDGSDKAGFEGALVD